MRLVSASTAVLVLICTVSATTVVPRWRFQTNGIVKSRISLPSFEVEAEERGFIATSYDGNVTMGSLAHGTSIWSFQSGGSIYSGAVWSKQGIYVGR